LVYYAIPAASQYSELLSSAVRCGEPYRLFLIVLSPFAGALFFLSFLEILATAFLENLSPPPKKAIFRFRV